jgi:hypothetical protein
MEERRTWPRHSGDELASSRDLVEIDRCQGNGGPVARPRARHWTPVAFDTSHPDLLLQRKDANAFTF